MEINHFADMDLNELPLMKSLPKVEETNIYDHPLLSVPSDFDWRTQGKVAGPLKQMQCGSCWAFTATSAIESAIAIKQQSAVNPISI
jgi:C1A family cysteine protease